MKENLEVVFGLLGGLALFLYGMNSMSDALQKAAGEKMKRILDSKKPPEQINCPGGSKVDAYNMHHFAGRSRRINAWRTD